MEERSCKVYMHINKINGKRYIGLTCQEVNDRWKNGSGYLSKNKDGTYKQPYFASSIFKCGWDNFEHIVVADNLTKKEAEQMEVELIAQYNTTDRRCGYNISNGGSSNGKHSEETKRKIGIANKGKKRTEEQRKMLSLAHIGSMCGENNPFYGKHHTEEARRKISKAGKNRDKSTYNHKSVYKIDLNTGNIIKEYFSVMDASIENGICDSSIIMCCKGKIGQSGGFKWQYVGEPHEYIPKSGNKRKVVQMDLDGNYIATFNSIQEASDLVGVSVSTISRSCNHITKKHKLYKWVYLDGYEGRVA